MNNEGFVFSSKEELLEQAKKDEACVYGLLWAKEKDSLETILKEIPLDYRLWCLRKGYFQFLNDCPWEKLDEYDWSILLSKQPQLLNLCSLENLDGWHWAYILSKHPKYSNMCSWEKLDGGDWRYLLTRQPQFFEFCKWEKLNNNDWKYLLIHQPQFETFKK